MHTPRTQTMMHSDRYNYSLKPEYLPVLRYGPAYSEEITFGDATPYKIATRFEDVRLEPMEITTEGLYRVTGRLVDVSGNALLDKSIILQPLEAVVTTEDFGAFVTEFDGSDYESVYMEFMGDTVYDGSKSETINLSGVDWWQRIKDFLRKYWWVIAIIAAVPLIGYAIYFKFMTRR